MIEIKNKSAYFNYFVEKEIESDQEEEKNQ